MAGNIELYQKMFKDDDKLIDEGELEWIKPGTPEYHELISELRSTYQT